MIAHKRARFRILVALVLGAAPRVAWGQDAPPPAYPPPAYPPPGYAPAPQSPVHQGFFLQMHLGAGFTSFTASGGSSGTESYSGRGIGFHLAVGAGVTENVALFGSVLTSSIGNYDLTVAGTDMGKVNAGAGLDWVGLGAIYYFEPLNLYVSGAFGLANVNVQDPAFNTIRRSNRGLAVEGMIGKEWWVSRHWGLGAALDLLGATKMQDKTDSAVSWSADAFNILFSATYF
jgi:hypothetical protein